MASVLATAKRKSLSQSTSGTFTDPEQDGDTTRSCSGCSLCRASVWCEQCSVFYCTRYVASEKIESKIVYDTFRNSMYT